MAFARVNIRDAGGQQLARRYRIRAVPTFLMLSPDGKVLYRKTGGTPERDAIERELSALQ